LVYLFVNLYLGKYYPMKGKFSFTKVVYLGSRDPRFKFGTPSYSWNWWIQTFEIWYLCGLWKV